MDSSAVVTLPHVAGPLRLHPFRGMMLAPHRIGDPAAARAFARPYRDVATRMTTWEKRGQIHHDASPAVYLHEFTAGGITVRGLVGTIDMAHLATGRSDRAVYPHEGIHPVQAAELTARMGEMQLNPAPILLVHRGSAAVRPLLERVMEETPDHRFVDRSQQRHRIWAIRAPADLAVLDEALAGSRALIADGHHRYAAYLQLQQAAPGGAHDFGLAMLVDQDDTPLFLGAIHRVLAGRTFTDVRGAAEVTGAVFTEVPEDDAVAALGPTTLVVTDGVRWASLELSVPHGRASVEILHESLLAVFPEGTRRIGYHHSVKDALAQVAATAGPPTGVAVLMPAPDIDLVLRIVAADRVLPEKATSFQPKPSVGVIIRSLLDG